MAKDDVTWILVLSLVGDSQISHSFRRSSNVGGLFHDLRKPKAKSARNDSTKDVCGTFVPIPPALIKQRCLPWLRRVGEEEKGWQHPLLWQPPHWLRRVLLV
jgi:hypothetical protein